MTMADPNRQLLSKLKLLRLGGVLETLDVRVKQAVDGQLAYVDFLQRLLEDEIERRNQKQLAMRVRRANFQADKTLARFDFSFNPQINKHQVLGLATCQFVARKQSVLIVGPSSMGKNSFGAGAWLGGMQAWLRCVACLLRTVAGEFGGRARRRQLRPPSASSAPARFADLGRLRAQAVARSCAGRVSLRHHQTKLNKQRG